LNSSLLKTGAGKSPADRSNSRRDGADLHDMHRTVRRARTDDAIDDGNVLLLPQPHSSRAHADASSASAPGLRRRPIGTVNRFMRANLKISAPKESGDI
jgi:hypothetical protein